MHFLQHYHYCFCKHYNICLAPLSYYFREAVQLRKKVYYNIINQTDYLTLVEEKRQIISGSLRRWVCYLKGKTMNIPRDVDEVCQDYELM